MEKLMRAGIMVAGLIALAGCAQKAPSAADEAAIRAINPAWFKAFNAHDVDGIVALYADDAVLNAPGSPPARGSAAIRETVARDVASATQSGISDNPGDNAEFGMSGDLGWEWNTFTVTDSSGKTVDTGKYLTVYAKKDGNWKIIRDIWNSDASPPAAKTVVITAQVRDAAKWEDGFRTHGALFKSQTVRSPIRFATTDKNEVTIRMDVDDLDKFFSIIDSPATAEAMKFDGVKRETVKFTVLDKELAIE